MREDPQIRTCCRQPSLGSLPEPGREGDHLCRGTVMYTPTHIPPPKVFPLSRGRKSYVRSRHTAPVEQRSILFSLEVFNCIGASGRTKPRSTSVFRTEKLDAPRKETWAQGERATTMHLGIQLGRCAYSAQGLPRSPLLDAVGGVAAEKLLSRL